MVGNQGGVRFVFGFGFASLWWAVSQDCLLRTYGTCTYGFDIGKQYSTEPEAAKQARATGAFSCELFSKNERAQRHALKRAPVCVSLNDETRIQTPISSRGWYLVDYCTVG